MSTKLKTRRYTAAEDQIILNNIGSSGMSLGCRLAARSLGRTFSSVMQRYYYMQRNNIKVTKSPATIRVIDNSDEITESYDGELKTMKLNIKGVEITMVFK